jgi:[acyl-carrier-protein] S-malonyltransferase
MKYKKIAVIFPGQGSQYVGMGKELYDRFKLVRDVFDEASSVVGYDMGDKCFKKPLIGSKLVYKADLDKTKYTQPAVFTTGYACYKIFEEMCCEVDVRCNVSFLAGHSLGEYTALAAAKAMDFRTCLSLVQKRANLITEFSDAYPDAGLMAIVNRGKELEFGLIEDLVKEVQVYVTLVNTRSQIVVGGFKKNLEELGRRLKKEGLIPTVLRVEGPFHSPLMKPAADRFKKDLSASHIHIGERPVIANVTSEAIVDPTHIRKELYEQIFTCVNWRRSVEKMVENGADLFIEVGPKKVLSNMIKDTGTSVSTMNVEDMDSLEKTVRDLGAQEE